MTGLPLPRLDDANAPHWMAAREGRLLVQRCYACGTYRFPAAGLCAACHDTRADWVEVALKGTIESFCTFHKAYFDGVAVPYTVLQVRLDCGVRLFANPAGAAAEGFAIGRRVSGTFEMVTPEVSLVRFGPIP